jgi:hypothetical protein
VADIWQFSGWYNKEVGSPPIPFRQVHMEIRKFWPLDFDPEGEIYENVAWDLPGYTRRRRELHRPDRNRAKRRR